MRQRYLLQVKAVGGNLRGPDATDVHPPVGSTCTCPIAIRERREAAFWFKAEWESSECELGDQSISC